MKIRTYLHRKTKNLGSVIVGGWLIAAISMFSPEPFSGIGLMISFPIFFIGILVFIFTVKCPKCGAQLGQLAPGQLNIWGNITGDDSAAINFCPKCGVNFDEEM